MPKVISVPLPLIPMIASPLKYTNSSFPHALSRPPQVL